MKKTYLALKGGQTIELLMEDTPSTNLLGDFRKYAEAQNKPTGSSRVKKYTHHLGGDTKKWGEIVVDFEGVNAAYNLPDK